MKLEKRTRNVNIGETNFALLQLTSFADRSLDTAGTIRQERRFVHGIEITNVGRAHALCLKLDDPRTTEVNV